jgi:hypothetical protein
LDQFWGYSSKTAKRSPLVYSTRKDFPSCFSNKLLPCGLKRQRGGSGGGGGGGGGGGSHMWWCLGEILHTFEKWRINERRSAAPIWLANNHSSF